MGGFCRRRTKPRLAVRRVELARWQARSDTRLTLALRNLLDTRYAEAVGFPAAGRTLFLSVQLDI